MRAFFGGQIKEEHRGGLVAIISRHGEQTPQEQNDNSELLMYDIFLYPLTSEEFINLTGVRAVSYPVERAYIGLSRKAIEKIMLEGNGIRSGVVDLRDVDRVLVIPHFLKSDLLEKPDKIVLKATGSGYEVAKTE